MTKGVWKRGCLIGAAVAAVLALLAPAGTARRHVVTPRVGDYWGECSGDTVSFQVFRARSGLRVRWVSLAGPKGEFSFSNNPRCGSYYNWPESTSGPIRNGYFLHLLWGHFTSPTSATGTWDVPTRRSPHWIAHLVQRRSVRGGSWSGTFGPWTLTFQVIRDGRMLDGQFHAPGCSYSELTALIQPGGEIFTAESTSGQSWTINGRFSSRTHASGTIDYCGHRYTWSAHHD